MNTQSINGRTTLRNQFSLLQFASLHFISLHSYKQRDRHTNTYTNNINVPRPYHILLLTFFRSHCFSYLPSSLPSLSYCLPFCVFFSLLVRFPFYPICCISILPQMNIQFRAISKLVIWFLSFSLSSSLFRFLFFCFSFAFTLTPTLTHTSRGNENYRFAQQIFHLIRSFFFSLLWKLLLCLFSLRFRVYVKNVIKCIECYFIVWQIKLTKRLAGMHHSSSEGNLWSWERKMNISKQRKCFEIKYE